MDARRILIVDDDEGIRRGLVETFATTPDVEAETVASGEEALSVLKGGRFDLILLDIRLPGIDGLRLLQEVRRTWADIPVILITAHGNVESVVEAMRNGAIDVIEKPFRPESIRAVVLAALDSDTRERMTDESYGKHVQLAKECLLARRTDAAVEHARCALALRPSRPEPFNILGVAEQLRMEIPEAQRYFRSALALDDGFSPARKNLENLSGFPKELSHFELED